MDTDIRHESIDKKSTCFKGSFWCSSRFVLIVIGFFGFMNLYALRVTMSVAIVCMTGPETNTSNTSSFANENVSESDMPEVQVSNQDDRFDWDKETQGLILGSFFLGYALTLLPSGWLAGRYGGKQLFGWSMFVCAVATLFTPLAARTSVVLLIVIRVFTGLCQGVGFPCMQTLLSYWIPPLQRSSSASFVYTGTQIGVMVTFPVSGVLCVDGFDGGWPSIFYVFGSLGVVWFFAWMYLVFDSPVLHPRICVMERKYIVEQLKSDIDISKKSSSTPWSKILTSLPVWAIIVSETCAEWGTYSFLTNIPTYMEDVLKFDSKKAGFLASLPYLGFWVVSNVSAHLADFLRERGYISTTTARKVFNSIGNILPAIIIVIMGNVADDPGIAVAMLILGVAMSGCQYGSGFIVNPVDIAPRYAGIIIGISATTGALGGFFAPLAIGFITVDKTKEQWKTVFYITAAIYTFGAIFYIIFASGELQDWARDEDDNQDINAWTCTWVEPHTFRELSGWLPGMKNSTFLTRFCQYW
ncbi:sialin-like [Mercenaria mercenaria]|uniref:sialin-like n=1 Tax=Mercenaria mercenaria TaxID=6596 RepID=UPI00234E8156|nr:sialin-like [Mercenaria mercenaria]